MFKVLKLVTVFVFFLSSLAACNSGNTNSPSNANDDNSKIGSTDEIVSMSTDKILMKNGTIAVSVSFKTKKSNITKYIEDGMGFESDIELLVTSLDTITSPVLEVAKSNPGCFLAQGIYSSKGAKITTDAEFSNTFQKPEVKLTPPAGSLAPTITLWVTKLEEKDFTDSLTGKASELKVSGRIEFWDVGGSNCLNTNIMLN